VDTAAEEWVRAQVTPVGAIETVHERPWATVSRVPVAGGIAWFKECAPVQGFEPRLTVALSSRWPDRVTEVLASDASAGWLLLGDAGTQVRTLGNPPSVWLSALPLYAELQRGEAEHVDEHLARGVPDLRVSKLPLRYDDLVSRDLPLSGDEIESLRRFAPRFGEMCAELDADGVPPSVQHDDLHMNNLYVGEGSWRVIDWGDTSISQPFMSLVITFRFLEEFNHLRPDDPWFARLRDAYLEPWGPGLQNTFDLAMRVGGFARAFALIRVRDVLPPDFLTAFDHDLATVLRRALTAADSP
jgi:hypothetical protein